MPLLAEFEVRVGAGGYKHAARSGAISAPDLPKRDSRNAQYHSMLRSESSVRSGMFIEADTQGPAPTCRLRRDVALHELGDSVGRHVGDLPHVAPQRRRPKIMECAGRAKRRRRFPPARSAPSSLQASPQSDPLHRKPKRRRRCALPAHSIRSSSHMG